MRETGDVRIERREERALSTLNFPSHVERSETPPRSGTSALPAKPENGLTVWDALPIGPFPAHAASGTPISTFGRLRFARGSFTSFRTTRCFAFRRKTLGATAAAMRGY